MIQQKLKLLANKNLPVRLALLVGLFATVGYLGINASHAATFAITSEAEAGSTSGNISPGDPIGASSGASVKFGSILPPTPSPSPSTGYPNATSSPHMVGAGTMAYTDANGVSQQITLKHLPTPGSSFGTNASGATTNCAYYDARGFIQPNADGCIIDGYDIVGVGIGQVWANNITISRNWFHNIDGQDSWAVWVHAHGNYSGLTITGNIVQGSSTTKTGPDGILKADGDTSNIVIKGNHSFNASSFVQFTPIAGTGSTPYGNIVSDNYIEAISDPSNYGLHLEQINVSSGTGGLLIQHNHITGPSGQTATIYLCHDAGNVGNITIDDNLFDGKPQNTIYGGDTGAAGGSLISIAKNIKITNNKFANTGGQNPGGYVIEPNPGDARLQTTGNVEYPSLAPIAGM